MKILIADNMKDSQLAIKRIIDKNGLDFEICDNGKDALELIRKTMDFRIVILNLALPGIDGISLCREIRRLNQARYIYIIVMSDQKQDINQAMEAGADDFITRPVEDNILNFRINTALRVLKMQDKLFNSQKELIKLVREDSLTALLNRRSCLDETIKHLERASREGYQVSAILIDIDNFKDVNETYGTEFGDLVLLEVANRLKFACRPYDTIGRYGGEEFFILLPNTKANSAEGIAKRLKTAISRKSYEFNKEKVKLNASMGVSCLSPDENVRSTQIDELVKKTETALGKAKHEGKDKIVISA